LDTLRDVDMRASGIDWPIDLEPPGIRPLALHDLAAHKDYVEQEVVRNAGDGFASVYAAEMFGRLFGQSKVTAARLAVWSYIDTAFRYCGTTLSMEVSFFASPLPSRFHIGLHLDNKNDWAEYAVTRWINLPSRRYSAHTTAFFL
jgi:hypothetical protein